MEHLVTICARKAYRQFVAGTTNEQLICLDDLKHAGVIGYLDASRRFDEKKGGEKHLFLGIRVRGAIIDWLRKQSIIHLPQEQYAKVKDLREAKNLLQKQGREAEPKELAEFLGWREDDVFRINALQPQVKSLDRKVNTTEGEGASLMDTLPGKEQQPLDKVMEKEVAHLIQGCLKNLPTDEDRILLHARMREELKLRHLAVRFGCSPQAIHQRQKRVLAMMRQCLESQGWQYDIG